MSVLTWIIGATFVISLIAFVGALTLFLKEKLLNKILMVLVSFSAGALVGGAFLHLMPEAIIEVGVDEVSILNVFLYLLLGFCIFFILEQLIRWHHHHATTHPEIMPFSYLILISDGIHNLIDGLVMAASFMVSFPIGIVTALAIALHEIPQEIGDFGVLVYGGFNRVRALILNYVSATMVIFGGITGYLLYAWIGTSIVFLLPFAAGNFIYIACTDLIPEIRFKESLKKSLVRFCIFLTGMGLMLAVKLF
ncbi:MAG: ZIP family metal transporter [Candidatus Bathyarchaeota archaeon]|nr:ZIP family metal transporter [Candidatus Bathyarchaeota archaeon]MDH5747056.1 ZIP family metal transporter [Candidatus Bathyarchaeota archaeon]